MISRSFASFATSSRGGINTLSQSNPKASAVLPGVTMNKALKIALMPVDYALNWPVSVVRVAAVAMGTAV